MFYHPDDGFLIVPFLKFAQFDATFADRNQQGSRQSSSESLRIFHSGQIVSRGHGAQDLRSLLRGTQNARMHIWSFLKKKVTRKWCTVSNSSGHWIKQYEEILIKKIKASRLCLLKRVIAVLYSDWPRLSCGMSDNCTHLWHRDRSFTCEYAEGNLCVHRCWVCAPLGAKIIFNCNYRVNENIFKSASWRV